MIRSNSCIGIHDPGIGVDEDCDGIDGVRRLYDETFETQLPVVSPTLHGWTVGAGLGRADGDSLELGSGTTYTDGFQIESGAVIVVLSAYVHGAGDLTLEDAAGLTSTQPVVVDGGQALEFAGLSTTRPPEIVRMDRGARRRRHLRRRRLPIRGGRRSTPHRPSPRRPLVPEVRPCATTAVDQP